MKNITINDLMSLSAERRVKLAQELIASVADIVSSRASFLTTAEQKEIARRVEGYKKSPAAACSLDELEADLHAS